MYQLEEHLNSLLSMIRNGQWDAIAAGADELASAISGVSVADPARNGALSNEQTAKIGRLLTLLQTAIASCAERQEQIGPLLEALAKPGRSSVKA